MLKGNALALSLILLAPLTAPAQQSEGELIYQALCAACHNEPPDETTPRIDALRQLDANTIVDSLASGTMRLQGQAMNPEQRVQVAEYIAGAPIAARVTRFDRGQCERAPGLPDLTAGTIWNGWGPDASNSRYQAAAGIVPGDVAKLELKWAFGIPNTQQSRSQPAVVGGRLFMGSQSGAVYALDAETGCLFWTFDAETWVRTAISVGPGPGGYAIYFTDAAAKAYAVDAQTGQLIWSRQIDDHPGRRGTGSPTLYDGVLYVPVSGVSEETAASNPDYECCTFRGSLTALDAVTGEVIWKTYTVPEPERRGTSTTGKPLWGPSGSPIWSAPTIDEKRGLIYAATGNGYADPPVETSDAILAFSMATGEIAWINQVMGPDTWIMGCGGDAPVGGRGGRGRGGPPGAGGGGGGPGGVAQAPNPNCPDDVGPDFDFSASPILTTLADGTDVLIATQKAGLGFALDPDDEGRTLWTYRWGQGSPVGGVWGATTDGERAYFAVADQFTENPGGVHGVDIATGERIWFSEPAAPLCGGGQGCSSAQSAALTSIPGVVFAGAADGGIRAHAASTGRVIWSFDTNGDFDTVNGIPASGGSMDGPGPVVSGGMLYVTSGNGGIVGTPGNVLLAFGVEE
ncbi:MAG TPA: PQQ-binding-like beta-propeller repeat protein [Gammaproteobacteria bacterium]|nr:PQQ-binding-like beta-propeller repeat protein [Gammaproteobacteria bacterium]